MSALNSVLVGVERRRPKNAEEAKVQLLDLLDRQPRLAPVLRKSVAQVAAEFGEPPACLPVLCRISAILDEWEAARCPQ